MDFLYTICLSLIPILFINHLVHKFNAPLVRPTAPVPAPVPVEPVVEPVPVAEEPWEVDYDSWIATNGIDFTEHQGQELPAIAESNDMGATADAEPERVVPQSVGAAAVNYDQLGIRELRAAARGRIPGFMQLRKAELVHRLRSLQ